MAGIKAGVVTVCKFVTSSSTVFGGYLDYMDRTEAVRNVNTDKFMDEKLFKKTRNAQNDYIDYMGNPEKTRALFTETSDLLTNEEKQAEKKLFEAARANGSPMWQSVISFDNRWLEEQGLFDGERKVADETKLREVTRAYVRSLQKSENLELIDWTASIHWNTDNMHLHIAMVEPEPTRPIIQEGKYAGQRRAAFQRKSMEMAKSAVVNLILDNQKENELINGLIRNSILGDKKERSLLQDAAFCNQFLETYNLLPADRKLWKYGNNAMKSLRPALDAMSDRFLEIYHPEDAKQLDAAMNTVEDRYKKAYGDSKYRTGYADGKREDLYHRLGNAILYEMREYDKSLKDPQRKKENTYGGSRVRALTGYPDNDLRQAVRRLEWLMKSSHQHYKNQAIHNQLEGDYGFDR